MKRCIYLLICTLNIALLLGCRQREVVEVTQYGPEFLTYSGSREKFNNACRSVLQELSYKEKSGENGTWYPHLAEGVSSHEEGETPVAMKAYMKTKGEDGAEYTVTIITLGNRDPLVMLESTSADKYKLANALNAEFQKRGIRVRQYK